MNILIAEDIAENREALRYVLESEGHHVLDAGDGVAALEILAREPVDAIISDILMPRMDGIELARAIKQDSGIAPVRVIILTSLGAHLDDSTRRHAGIEQCMFKPVRRVRLYTSLTQTLASSRHASGTSPTPVCHSQALRVLLAEDNPVNQKVALAQLQKLGLAADVVPDGRQAVEAQIRCRYGVILMDWQMPEMEGSEAARLIRENESEMKSSLDHPAYIIAMTAHALEGDREKCIAAGMNDYLSKPVSLPALEAALNRAARALDGASGCPGIVSGPGVPVSI